MGKRREERAKETKPTAAKESSPRRGGRPSWFATHGRDLRFLGLFAFCLGVFYALSVTQIAKERIFPGYLRLNASVSAVILSAFGEEIEARGQALISSKMALSIARGCDAVEPAALFCAAVLASPVAFSSRCVAVVVGTMLLMVLNLLRILSLYYVGAYYRPAFDVVHLDVWQALFIFLAILFWALWASWATRRQGKLHHAPT